MIIPLSTHDLEELYLGGLPPYDALDLFPLDDLLGGLLYDTVDGCLVLLFFEHIHPILLYLSGLYLPLSYLGLFPLLLVLCED